MLLNFVWEYCLQWFCADTNLIRKEKSAESRRIRVEMTAMKRLDDKTLSYQLVHYCW